MKLGQLAVHAFVLVVVIAWIVAACYAGPDAPEATGGTPGGIWSYATGPHGENCLFFADGSGQTATLAMDCDSVKP